ncbi:ATP synthase subunit alpha, chloroplastic, partial [Mucuna pruriens]
MNIKFQVGDDIASICGHDEIMVGEVVKFEEDKQMSKTTVIIDTILNQQIQNVIYVFVTIYQIASHVSQIMIRATLVEYYVQLTPHLIIYDDPSKQV